MSKSILLAILFVVISLVFQDCSGQDFVCPAKDMATGCPEPEDCMYPNPDDAKTFYHCVPNSDGSTGTLFVKNCPDTTVWNDDLKECDFPSGSTINDISVANTAPKRILPGRILKVAVAKESAPSESTVKDNTGEKPATNDEPAEKATVKKRSVKHNLARLTPTE